MRLARYLKREFLRGRKFWKTLENSGGVMAGKSKVTTDHDEIKRWVEERGGWPATVSDTVKGGAPGVLRIDYPGFSGKDTLKKINWDEFFKAFEKNELAFLYQDEVSTGEESRFSKFIARASTKETRSAKA
jgi:hypothetical protein